MKLMLLILTIFYENGFFKSSVELEIFGSGSILHHFLESIRTAKDKNVKVAIPR